MPPPLVVSGEGAKKEAQEFLKEIGVRKFLPKPFQITRLVEKVKEACRKSKAVPNVRKGDGPDYEPPASSSNWRRASNQSVIASPGPESWRRRCEIR